MALSIKKRIYCSFFILTSIFIINGVIIIATLNHNNNLSCHISEVLDPSLQSLNDFELLLIKSREFSINWVFLRADDHYKQTLREIHNTSYPVLKSKLEASSAYWTDSYIQDSLHNMFSRFENLILHEKTIMNSLATFEDYDDVVKKFAAEEILENHIIPQTNSILFTLNAVISAQQNMITREENKVKVASSFMRTLILILAISIIVLAIVLSLYMNKIIIKPIDKIINIVDDLGRGIIRKSNHAANEDEMGRMIMSVNNLSENLSLSTLFADEIGKRNFSAEFNPLSDEDKLGKALIAMRDNLKSSHESLNIAQHLAQMGSWERDIESKKILWSDELCRIFDVDPSSFNGKYETYLNGIHPEDSGYVKNISIKYMYDHQPFSYECRIITQKGNNKIIYVQGKVIADTEGKVIKTFGIVQDITQRKVIEKELIESENKYRGLFEKMLDGVYKSSSEGKFIDVNPALVEMLGYENKDELMAIDIKAELYFEESERDHMVSEHQPDGTDVFRLRKKDGTEIWVEDRGQYILDENGNTLYHEGILRDVTKRMQIEEALSANELKFRSLIENSADMIGMMDATGKFIYVSPGVIKKFGYTYEELFDMTIMEVIHPDDIEKAQSFLGEVFQNPLIPKDGLVIRERCKNGNYIWAEGTITNLLSLDGVNAIVANFRDITEKKEQQDTLESSNKELIKSNLELDKFVYSVSHDLRAPLLSMKGVVSITAEETKEELTSEHMQMLNGSITRLDNFIGEILEYSRNARTELKKSTIDFQELVHNITDDLRFVRSDDKLVNIEVNINETGTFCTDRGRLSVVLNNLISNGIRYYNPKAENPFVKIRIDSDDVQTQIIIEDNGIGISKEHQLKIFEMFYRVSENSVGSGLGLYIVKETVDKLNGKIKVESQTGIGTKFTLTLPNLLFQ